MSTFVFFPFGFAIDVRFSLCFGSPNNFHLYAFNFGWVVMISVFYFVFLFQIFSHSTLMLLTMSIESVSPPYHIGTIPGKPFKSIK